MQVVSTPCALPESPLHQSWVEAQAGLVSCAGSYASLPATLSPGAVSWAERGLDTSVLLPDHFLRAKDTAASLAVLASLPPLLSWDSMGGGHE